MTEKKLKLKFKALLQACSELIKVEILLRPMF